MKATVRKDPRTGWWHWDVTGYGLRATGERENWEDALTEALGDLGWIAEHQQAWPDGLAALGWRPLRKSVPGHVCEQRLQGVTWS